MAWSFSAFQESEDFLQVFVDLADVADVPPVEVLGVGCGLVMEGGFDPPQEAQGPGVHGGVFGPVVLVHGAATMRPAPVPVQGKIKKRLPKIELDFYSTDPLRIRLFETVNWSR